ncbi:hypothetical protein [Bacillus thuringiensis]|uniref:hypothetical protein n=1 Tax=Bacillus thuringiensis TaxID=1428 RepID=UPI001593323A|nr:hypothetical protein [Bacillus thuringiensis]
MSKFVAHLQKGYFIHYHNKRDSYNRKSLFYYAKLSLAEGLLLHKAGPSTNKNLLSLRLQS